MRRKKGVYMVYKVYIVDKVIMCLLSHTSVFFANPLRTLRYSNAEGPEDTQRARRISLYSITPQYP